MDPGIKAAFAALDLGGKLVASGTFKGADPDSMVAEIEKIGSPSIIASDVNPAPSFVLKIAARFNARTFIPERTILQDEKDVIAGRMDNRHERDAYTGATKCYRFYANRLRQIDLMDTHLDKDALKHLVIQGFPLHAAVLRLEKKAAGIQAGNGPEPPPAKPRENGKTDDGLIALSEENVNLRKALESERLRAAALEREIVKAKGARYVEIMKEKEVRRLKSENERMSWLVGRLKRKIGKRPGT